MSLNKINIDFQVLKTYDPKVLVIADTSEWSVIEDKPAIIEITIPGANNPSIHYVDKNKINVYTSALLGINCGAECEEDLIEIPDGIYHIHMKGSPDTFEKERYYLRTEKLQLKLDKAYVALGKDINHADKDVVELLWTCKLLIEAADASTRLGEIAMASDYYKQAKRIIDSYLDCQE